MTDDHQELARQMLRPLLKRADLGVYDLLSALAVAAGLLIAGLEKAAPTERVAEKLVPLFFDITREVLREREDAPQDA